MGRGLSKYAIGATDGQEQVTLRALATVNTGPNSTSFLWYLF